MARITGTNDNDILDGTSDDDVIFALAGDDLISAGAGNDIAHGDAGGDQILGDDGDDFLTGGEGWDFINGGFGNDRIDGGASNDELWGLPGDDTIFGGDGPDRLFGNEGADNLSGDLISSAQAVAYDDLLVGGDDADLLVGDSTATLFTVPYQQNLSPPEPGGVPIPVGLGLRQDGGDDVLDGGTGDDILIGDANFIHAGRGGDDILLGGDGNDRLYGDAYTGFVTVGGVGPGPPAPPTFLVPGAGIGGSGAGGDDYLDGGVDTLKGGNGDDILVGDAMSMARSTASGGGDFLYGGDGNDALAGDALRDDNGLGGNDWLFGEASDDTLRGGSGNDTLDGGDGTDTAVFDGDLADFKVGGGSAENGILVTELATGATDILFHAELLRFSDIDYLLAQVTSQWFAARAARARGSAEVGRENDDGATEDGLVLGDACGRVRHVRRGRCGLGAKRQLPDAGGENKARQLLLSRRSRMCRQVQRPDDLLSSVRHRGPQVVRRERRLQLIPPRRLVISCR